MPLKHFCNFRRTLNIPVNNCEISLVLKWSRNIVLVDEITHAAVAAQAVKKAGN